MSDRFRSDANAFLSRHVMLSLERCMGLSSNSFLISPSTNLIYVSRAGSLLDGGVHLDFPLKGLIDVWMLFPSS